MCDNCTVLQGQVEVLAKTVESLAARLDKVDNGLKQSVKSTSNILTEHKKRTDVLESLLSLMIKGTNANFQSVWHVVQMIIDDITNMKSEMEKDPFGSVQLPIRNRLH
jgi:hypothetical protein